MNQPLSGLRERRVFRRITQTDLAALIGVNQSHYRQIERGDVRLDVHRAKLLADRLECSIEDLL
jgi:transcriptional regulator with XRE-family HTH domain